MKNRAYESESKTTETDVMRKHEKTIERTYDENRE